MPLFEDDPDLIRRQERQVREQAERARVMRQQIEAVQGVGNSPDNSVEVVVDSGGTLLGIGIEGVSNEVCEAIMAAYAAARRDAGEQVISASQAAFGENYAGIERMRSLYGVPDPEEPEDEAPHPWTNARRP
ncbi:hypothetical protein [Schaalia odontolytica]|jgi:hypothetical protein|uniref:hypothetical protein n=1 Tax=Schaalia odontolytica TaxID=1660 RepID=UPI001D05C8CE|nr:hypothetical protein [Schaalia odontolytica]MCB6402894.1 hypothetical protein [Schaalia odontolytica]MEE0239746.1 hypothetical protein [Pauljensenia sp.]